LLDGSGNFPIPLIQSNSQGDRLIRDGHVTTRNLIQSGNPLAGFGISISQAISSLPSLSDVSLKCGTSQVNHGFLIQVPGTIALYAGKGIFMMSITKCQAHPTNFCLILD
jgi:hypothetical protein